MLVEGKFLGACALAMIAITSSNTASLDFWKSLNNYFAYFL